MPQSVIRRCRAPLPMGRRFGLYQPRGAGAQGAQRGELPASFYTDPLMYQGGSDSFVGPRDTVVADPAWGIDFEAEVAVVTGDVPMGATPEQAAAAIRLVMLVNDVSLRNLIPGELARASASSSPSRPPPSARWR